MKKKILFVDDDPLLLQFYRAIMEKEKSRWDVSTSDDAAKALELLDREGFDVLVSDLRMPGIDGIAFMREVSQKHPRAARITVSGLQDQEELARCLEATHQFLPKPFDIKLFKATLSRVCELNSFLGDEQLQSIVSKIEFLPSFPSLYLQIMTEINSKDSSLESIAGIVAKDPGITAKILQVINSAAFGCPRKISSVLEAIQHLGLSTLQSLVLSSHVFTSFEGVKIQGWSVEKLLDHATQTANLSRSILKAEGADLDSQEAAYTSGLLHDIGKLMMARGMPQQFRTALAQAAAENIPFCEAETRVFGANHARVGAYLLGLWGLPATIVEAVAFHHTPHLSGSDSLSPLAAVHAANILLHGAEGSEAGNVRSSLNLDYLASLGLADHVEQWRTFVKQE